MAEPYVQEHALPPLPGWATHPAFIALQDRLREESILFAACVSEGFCPRCKGRLLPPELPSRDGFCPACDQAWRVGPRHESGGHDWSGMAGWFYRECIARGEGSQPAPSHDAASEVVPSAPAAPGGEP